MQIVQEKPIITAVLKSKKLVIGQKDKQTERHTGALKIYSCLKEFETANFETPNPKMTLIDLSNPSTLPGNMYSLKKTGLAFLNLAVKNYLESRLELTKTGSLVDIGRKTEAYSSGLAWTSEN